MDEGDRMTRTMADIQDKANVKTVFGESRQVGDKTIIPVATVAWAGGYGFGRGPGRREGGAAPAATGEAPSGHAEEVGAGVGGRLRVRPVAIVEVTPTETKVRPVVDQMAIIRGGILVGAWNVYWITKTLRAIFAKRR